LAAGGRTARQTPPPHPPITLPPINSPCWARLTWLSWRPMRLVCLWRATLATARTFACSFRAAWC
jgi:hypothetical protein